MTTSSAIQEQHSVSVVRLIKEGNWVQLAFWLGGEFNGGDLVQVAERASFSAEGTDELAKSYQRVNWLSGVTSGALYAFRALQIPRRRVVLNEFSGQLRAADMETVAKGAALAIATLVHRELPLLFLEGWAVQVQTLNQTPSGGEAQGQRSTDRLYSSRKVVFVKWGPYDSFGT